MEPIKRIFRKPTPLELASKELAEAERALLEAETAVEYAQSVVNYNRARIGRLKEYIRGRE